MIGQTIDVTDTLNADNAVVLDVGGWENVIIQTVNPSGTITLQGTNDGGASNTQNESPATAANFTNLQATNMADGTGTTSLAVAGLYKVTQPSKYIKIGGAAAAADKCLVFLSKVV
jgi:hypothetical protein